MKEVKTKQTAFLPKFDDEAQDSQHDKSDSASTGDAYECECVLACTALLDSPLVAALQE